MVTDNHADLTVSWCGSTWRTFPQPKVAREESTRRHLSDEIRAYLGGRPDHVFLAKEIAVALDTSGDEIRNRLDGLLTSLEVERVQIVKWGAKQWAYRWVQKPEAPKPLRRIRPTAAEYKAMRNRLRTGPDARAH